MLKKILFWLVAGVSLFIGVQSVQAAEQKLPHVLLTTTMGNIELELNDQQAPISTKNFITYVEQGFYNNTIFHRVIPGFMIQGGGFDSNMQTKSTRAAIANEAENGLKNTLGTIAMARTADKDSATSQFFINVADNPFLDHGQRDFGYAVFGKVVSGMDVVEKIAQLPVNTVGPHENVPTTPVIITSAQVVK